MKFSQAAFFSLFFGLPVELKTIPSFQRASKFTQSKTQIKTEKEIKGGIEKKKNLVAAGNRHLSCLFIRPNE